MTDTISVYGLLTYIGVGQGEKKKEGRGRYALAVETRGFANHVFRLIT